MKTWEKTGCKVILLSYDNLANYLRPKDYRLLMKNKHYYSPPQISDAVRVMVLDKHKSGIWMDCDTIVADDFKKIALISSGSELTMVAKHLAFLSVDNSKIIHAWYKSLVKKLDRRKRFSLVRRVYWKIKTIKYLLFRQTDGIERINNIIYESPEWDYLGNSIINDLIDHASAEEYRDLVAHMPYQSFLLEARDKHQTPYDRYVNYYFHARVKRVPKITAPFVYLHNSWTPDEYKKLSTKQILSDQRPLSRLLQSLQKP